MTHARTHARTHGANYDLPPASRAGDKNWLSAILLEIICIYSFSVGE